MVLDGRPAVFISCSDAFKRRVAYAFRDIIETSGLRAVIVSDLPRLGGTFGPEDKVAEYLKRSDVFLALCTPDDQLADGETFQPRPNVVDEIARARQLIHIADRVVVVKEASVRLHSNINPVYEHLDVDDPGPAVAAFVQQMAVWGYELVHPSQESVRPSEARSPIDEVHDLLPGLRVDDPLKTADAVRAKLATLRKAQQAMFVAAIAEAARSADLWETRSICGHMLESLVEIDSSLVSVELLDELSRHPDSSIRSSAGVMCFLQAVSDPGRVPIDVASRLARPATEDWYAATPALNALKQLALTRRQALRAIEDLLTSDMVDDHEAAAYALLVIARHRPRLIETATVNRILSSSSSAAREAGAALKEIVDSIPEGERGSGYSPFSAF